MQSFGNMYRRNFVKNANIKESIGCFIVYVNLKDSNSKFFEKCNILAVETYSCSDTREEAKHQILIDYEILKKQEKELQLSFTEIQGYNECENVLTKGLVS